MTPTKVRIMGVDWSVVEDGKRAQKENVTGETDHDNLEILLDADIPEQHKRTTLLHEIIHAIDNFTHEPKNHLEEDQVRCLTAGIYQVLRDNPILAMWLLGKEEGDTHE